ncbi:iron donor protein CyaY [Burkholderiaceae bacterium DAT-1]|nr:iron donor protein CyaY [Burkholderiaceae bacterium DAT-1]
MNESDFLELADAMFERIESALDAQSIDCDINVTGGVMELSFDDGAKVIINRHTPNREIWVAARSGGFHYKYADHVWRNTRDDGLLTAQLSALVSAHADTAFSL